MDIFEGMHYVVSYWHKKRAFKFSQIKREVQKVSKKLFTTAAFIFSKKMNLYVINGSILAQIFIQNKQQLFASTPNHHCCKQNQSQLSPYLCMMRTNDMTSIRLSMNCSFSCCKTHEYCCTEYLNTFFPKMTFLRFFSCYSSREP